MCSLFDIQHEARFSPPYCNKREPPLINGTLVHDNRQGNLTNNRIVPGVPVIGEADLACKSRSNNVVRKSVEEHIDRIGWIHYWISAANNLICLIDYGRDR